MKCEKGISFEDCELSIMREAVDKIEKIKGEKLLNGTDVRKILDILEGFLRKKKLICYGGTAINNILPIDKQFYDKDVELPDYDFFSPNALDDAKELADLYAGLGYDVEAKAGVHRGTFKVYVNFMAVADITQMVSELFKSLKAEALKIDGIMYAPPNYLRMAMYLELSRPMGDVSRWEKVLKRIVLLNEAYPIKFPECNMEMIQRIFNAGIQTAESQTFKETVFDVTLRALISQGVVFFGAFAHKMYLRTMPKIKLLHIPDFDVLSEDPMKTAEYVRDRLRDAGVKRVRIVHKEGVGEIIAPHEEIKIGVETILFIYKPLACHSYNVVKYRGQSVRIASIDTILSFYLAFMFVKRPYYDKDRLLCMSNYLFMVQQRNRLAQTGLLRRFSATCFGEQETLEKIRNEKAVKFEQLKTKKNTREYDELFLKYVPKANKTKKNVG